MDGARLAFAVGAAELHEVAADLNEDGLVSIFIDGHLRAEIRRPAMVGGYAFEVGSEEKHRVELFFIEADPPRLDARVDGERVAAAPRRERNPFHGAAVAVGIAGVSLLAPGIAAQAGAGWAFRMGFDTPSLFFGGALLVLCAFVYRGQLWAALLAAAVATAAVAADLGLAARAHALRTTPSIALELAAALLLISMAATLWRHRRRTAPRPVTAPAEGEIFGRCTLHASFARAACHGCRRALCPECPAFEGRGALLCEDCARRQWLW
jgi:hypothetical protein